MKRLEKRVERELGDILYSIIKSNPSSFITIKVGNGIEIIINTVMNPEYLFHSHIVSIVNKSKLLLQTTIITNPYENGYIVQSLQFKRKQRLKEKDGW